MWVAMWLSKSDGTPIDCDQQKENELRDMAQAKWSDAVKIKYGRMTPLEEAFMAQLPNTAKGIHQYYVVEVFPQSRPENCCALLVAVPGDSMVAPAAYEAVVNMEYSQWEGQAPRRAILVPSAQLPHPPRGRPVEKGKGGNNRDRFSGGKSKKRASSKGGSPRPASAKRQTYAVTAGPASSAAGSFHSASSTGFGMGRRALQVGMAASTATHGNSLHLVPEAPISPAHTPTAQTVLTTVLLLTLLFSSLWVLYVFTVRRRQAPPGGPSPRVSGGVDIHKEPTAPF